MGKRISAQLIGERSAGMTAVEIYEADNLVWSHMWFGDGCSQQGYISGLRDALRCLCQPEDWQGWDGGDYDDDGTPTLYDNGDTTGVIIERISGGEWIVGDRYGQSDEILDALIAEGIVPQDADYDPDESDVIVALRKILRSDKVETLNR